MGGWPAMPEPDPLGMADGPVVLPATQNILNGPRNIVCRLLGGTSSNGGKDKNGRKILV